SGPDRSPPSSGAAGTVKNSREGMKLDLPDETPVPKVAAPPAPSAPPQPAPVTTIDRKKVWQDAINIVENAWKTKEIYEDISEKLNDYIEQPSPWEKNDKIKSEFHDLTKKAISDNIRDDMKCKELKPDDPDFKAIKKFCDSVADESGNILTNLKNTVGGAVERVKHIVDLRGRYEEVLDDLSQRIKDFHP